jgi:hypothetical protein
MTVTTTPATTTVVSSWWEDISLTQFLFYIDPSFRNCPCTRCTTVTSSGCSYFDVFKESDWHISQIWYYFNTMVCHNEWLRFFVSYMPCLLSFVICVCMLCCLWYGPLGCRHSTLISKNCCCGVTDNSKEIINIQSYLTWCKLQRNCKNLVYGCIQWWGW